MASGLPAFLAGCPNFPQRPRPRRTEAQDLPQPWAAADLRQLSGLPAFLTDCPNFPQRPRPRWTEAQALPQPWATAGLHQLHGAPAKTSYRTLFQTFQSPLTPSEALSSATDDSVPILCGLSCLQLPKPLLPILATVVPIALHRILRIHVLALHKRPSPSSCLSLGVVDEELGLESIN